MELDAIRAVGSDVVKGMHFNAVERTKKQTTS